MQPTAEQLKTTGGKAVEGAYYGGQRLMGGKLLAPGQDTEGHDISADVIAQTSPNNVNFVNQQRAQAGMTASPTNAGNAVPSGMPGGGGGGAQPSAAPAIPDLAALYDNAYTKNPDVIAANAKIADIQSKITAREKALNDAVAGENDNPFYSEATRVGRVQKLNDNFNNDKNALTGELGTAQTSIANLQAEAQRQVNIAQGQYTLNNDAYKQNLDEFNTLLSAGGLTNADPSTLSQISVSTGISLGMLSSIQQSQQAKNTQIVTSTDNAGNLNITAVNSQTGKILHSETLGGVGKSTGGGSGSGKVTVANGLSAMTPKLISRLNSYGNISPGDWNQAQAEWIGAGLPKSDFVSNFGQYADTNRGDFVSAYGFQNPKTAATIKNNQATNSTPVN